jgi:hypothetical protein
MNQTLVSFALAKGMPATYLKSSLAPHEGAPSN